MRFLCLGYCDEQKWAKMSQVDQEAMMKQCFAYDEKLRTKGHYVGCIGLQSASNARTLKFENAKMVVTDGPFAETKEQIGGILILEAKDMDEAVQLMSKHPAVRLGGPFEIRPADGSCDALIEAQKS